MTCTPAGSLAQPVLTPAICHCGAIVRPVPAGTIDWAWADKHGQTGTSNVIEIFAELARIEAAIADGIADTPDWNRYGQITSGIATHHGIDWGHQHSPTGSAGESSTPPPWCCGQPMQAVPSGWRCRTARTIHPYLPA